MTILFVTGLLLAAIGFFLILNKKFKRHPYRLLGGVCLIEGMQFNNIYNAMYPCYYPKLIWFQRWMIYYFFLFFGIKYDPPYRPGANYEIVNINYKIY